MLFLPVFMGWRFFFISGWCGVSGIWGLLTCAGVVEEEDEVFVEEVTGSIWAREVCRMCR